jgi:drug/metabolite transporter (DMT)-like permease
MPQPKLTLQALMAALSAAASWGMAGVWIRWLPGWSPFSILTGRFLIATAVLLPLFFLVPAARQGLRRSLSTPSIWYLSGLAIAGYVLGTTAFQMAPVGEVTLLFTTSPLFVIAYQAAVRLPIHRNEALGTALAMVGVSLIMLPQLLVDRAIALPAIGGYLLALSAAGSLAIYTLWLNRLTQQAIAPKSLHIVFLTCLLGGIVSCLGAGFFNRSVGIGLNPHVLLVLLGLGVVSTALPFLCYTMAAQQLPVVLTTAILLLEPIFAALFASIALEEIPSLGFALGSLFVFGGVLLIVPKDKEL